MVLLLCALLIPEGNVVRLPHQTQFNVRESDEILFKNTRSPHYTFQENTLWGSTLFYPKDWEDMPLLLMINLQWRTDEASILWITSEDQEVIDLGIDGISHPFDPMNSREYHQKMSFVVFNALSNSQEITIHQKPLTPSQKSKLESVLKDYLRLVHKVP